MLNLRDEKCTKTDCSACTTCVYDEGNLEENMTDKTIPFSYTYCNDCPNSIKQEVLTTYKTYKYLNWYCGKVIAPYTVNTGAPTQRSIEMSSLEGRKVTPPFWCPFKKKAEEAKKQLEEEKKAEEEKNKPKPKIKDLTYKERYDLWKELEGRIEWDDIKEGEIYHVPPVMTDKRMDILITFKNKYSCAYKNLTKGTTLVDTFYPTSMMARFLVKHKIKDIKIVKS